jgi:type II secretory pathway component PulC
LEQPVIEQMYLVPQPILFMYASRAGLNPNEFMQKLQVTHQSLDTRLGGYLLSRQQHLAMLYKAGIKKSEMVLSENEETVLGKIDTATLIQELERRTRN